MFVHRLNNTETRDWCLRTEGFRSARQSFQSLELVKINFNDFFVLERSSLPSPLSMKNQQGFAKNTCCGLHPHAQCSSSRKTDPEAWFCCHLWWRGPSFIKRSCSPYCTILFFHPPRLLHHPSLTHPSPLAFCVP